MAKTDPLAEALGQATISSGNSGSFKVDAVFGERPLVLAAIRDARNRSSPVSYRAISRLLTADCRQLISVGAVTNWCVSQGLP